MFELKLITLLKKKFLETVKVVEFEFLTPVCKVALINEINLKLQGNLNVFIPFLCTR